MPSLAPSQLGVGVDSSLEGALADVFGDDHMAHQVVDAYRLLGIWNLARVSQADGCNQLDSCLVIISRPTRRWLETGPA